MRPRAHVPHGGPTKGVASLDITISSRHAELSEALVATTRQKISRLERLNGQLERAEVHFYEERNPRIADREVCEVWMDGRGQRLRCKVSAPDGFVAVDRAVSKLEHQLGKLKTRRTGH
jgi:putative sigma-54 modulation protein